MQRFSAHHAQRGDATAVVWGAPGARPPTENQSAVTAAATQECGAPSRGWRVDAEKLTRRRRAATPFVQQCDLVFPLPVGVDGSGTSNDGSICGEDRREQSKAERRAGAFVTEALGTPFYYRARGPLSALLRQPFLGSCVLRGSFSALALNAPTDQGNSFAIMPGGILNISLDRESFQTLGLPGEAARTRPKGNSKRAGAGAGSTGGSVDVLGGGAGACDRYVSSFDLSSKAFRPGKPLHDRLLSCLGGDEGAASTEGAFDMLVCWWDDGEDGGMESRRCGADLPRKTAPEAERVASVVEAEVEGEGGRKEAVDSGVARNVGHDGSIRQAGQWRQHCKEVAFPSSFSAEKIDLRPEIRFFREACCPDLDFVGQDLVAPAPSPPSSQSEDRVRDENELRKNAGVRMAGNEEGGNTGRTATAAGGGGELQQSQAPPGSAKCRLALDMFEWLGAVSCGLEALLRRDPSPPEPYLSEFETPRHLRYRRHRTMCRARLRGFLPPLAVSRCVTAAGAVAAVAEAEAASRTSAVNQDREALRECLRTRGPVDGCSWGAVMGWPFRDAPLAYPGADAPCGGGQRTSKRGGGGGTPAERSTKQWPVGGHGVYAVVACPNETAVAYVAARCPGPGW